LGRHPRRPRLHPAELRLPRRALRVRAARGRVGRDQRPERRRAGRVRGARAHPLPAAQRRRLRLGAALGLPTFEVDGRSFYKRLTFVAVEARIVKVFYPVFPPDRDAGEALAWLRGYAGEGVGR
jgi:hypothetical protein